MGGGEGMKKPFCYHKIMTGLNRHLKGYEGCKVYLREKL
jgi:hypothetical protein